MMIGHPSCGQKQRCVGGKKDWLVRQIHEGEEGNTYCNSCWYLLLLESSSIVCEVVGSDEETIGEDVEMPGHPRCRMRADCIGNNEDGLMRHIEPGTAQDLYCTSCWRMFEEDIPCLRGDLVEDRYFRPLSVMSRTSASRCPAEDVRRKVRCEVRREVCRKVRRKVRRRLFGD